MGIVLHYLLCWIKVCPDKNVEVCRLFSWLKPPRINHTFLTTNSNVKHHVGLVCMFTCIDLYFMLKNVYNLHLINMMLAWPGSERDDFTFFCSGNKINCIKLLRFQPVAKSSFC